MNRLLFIASPGHTGSTLLDLLLGNHPDAVSVGELHRLDHWAAHPDVRTCTCGKTVPDCPFWRRVEDRLRERTGRSDLSLATFPTHVPQSTSALHRRVPRMEDLAWTLGSRRLWRLAARLDAGVRAQDEVSANVALVYEAVTSITGARVVVDSSKTPGTLKNRWFRHRDVMRVLLQVRDGRAICGSQIRREGVGMDVAVRQWRRQNLNLLAASATIPRWAILRSPYEALCRDPLGEIERISRFAGLDEPPRDLVLRKEEAHNIGGNAMRYRRDEAGVRLDERWKDDLGQAELQEFDRVGGRLNRWLGYE